MDPKTTQSSQDIRYSTNLPSTYDIVLSNRTINSIPQTLKDVKRDNATTINKSQWTINPPKQKEVDTTISVRDRPRPVRSAETLQGDGTSPKVSTGVSVIRTFNDQPKDKQDPKGKEFETLKKEDNAILKPVGDVAYDVNLPKNVTVQHQTPQGDIEDGTLTYRELVTGPTHTEDSMVQKTSIGDVLRTYKTQKGDNGHLLQIKNSIILKETITSM